VIRFLLAGSVCAGIEGIVSKGIKRSETEGDQIVTKGDMIFTITIH